MLICHLRLSSRYIYPLEKYYSFSTAIVSTMDKAMGDPPNKEDVVTQYSEWLFVSLGRLTTAQQL